MGCREGAVASEDVGGTVSGVVVFCDDGYFAVVGIYEQGLGIEYAGWGIGVGQGKGLDEFSDCFLQD